MKELTSYHDDLEKRLAIFFGLGAFILSALIGLSRGYAIEGLLLRGVVVLILATLGGWLFGAWFKEALRTATPAEEVPANVERRVTTPDPLGDGSVVVSTHGAAPVVSDESNEPLTGHSINYVLPELNPAEEAALNAIAAAGPDAHEAAPEPAAPAAPAAPRK